MITSKDVFAKRREGKVDEAYRMALQLMDNPHPEEWDIKAFGWCLIDVIKRDAPNGNSENLARYRQQLETISGPALDEVLAKSKGYALSLCNPNASEINQAKELSKSGKHEQSIAIYKQLIDNGETDINVATSLGWELYKASKELLNRTPVIFGKIKMYLNWYLKLNVEKPTLLHSLMLQVANKCAAENNIDMLAFSHYWGLENLRADDCESFRTDDGVEIPSIAERVLIQAVKAGVANGNVDSLNRLQPFLDKIIKKIPESIWLKQSKVKLLVCTGRPDEALQSAIQVVKEKSRDYWAWELLGDLHSANEPEVAFSCYCKALTCNGDINFTSKVRLKLVEILVNRNQFSEAKFELISIQSHKESAGHKIPEPIQRAISKDWYSVTEPSESNQSLYRQNVRLAEEILYADLPWYHANVGEKFSVKDKPGKFKRKLHTNTGTVCVEANIPNSRFQFDNLSVGDGIKVKGEFNKDRRFEVYVVESREFDSSWDAIPEQIGVVDHVNLNKGVLHFVVDKTCHGILKLGDASAEYQEGDSVALRLTQYHSKSGKRFSILKNNRTSKSPPVTTKKEFSENVRVDNGMGFTSSDIFIPPPLVRRFEINSDKIITGTAVINFNDKRGVWGWKALSISSVEEA